jgi:hypothetical protein
VEVDGRTALHSRLRLTSHMTHADTDCPLSSLLIPYAWPFNTLHQLYCVASSVCRCGKHAESVMKSTHELETVVTIISANERQMRRHDPLRPYIDLISNELGEAELAKDDAPLETPLGFCYNLKQTLLNCLGLTQ